MLLDGFGDLPPDRQHRVQRRHRLLEDHADVAAPHLADLLLGQPQQVAPGKDDLTLGDPPRRVGDQAQDRQRAGRFARPALADDRDRLAALDSIGNAGDRGHHTGAGAKLGVQISDF